MLSLTTLLARIMVSGLLIVDLGVARSIMALQVAFDTCVLETCITLATLWCSIPGGRFTPLILVTLGQLWGL